MVMHRAELDLFRQSCGASGPLELEFILPGQVTPRRHTFKRPFVLLGRAPGNDVPLPVGRVSRRHVYLQMIGGGLFFADLGSRTGIRLHGEPTAHGWLSPGQAIEIDSVGIRLPRECHGHYPLVPSAHPVDPTATLPASHPATPHVILEITNSRGRQVRWCLNRVLTLAGTDLVCKARFLGSRVSRFHCSFLYTPQGLWVIDLLSRCGTLVNGTPVRWARLAEEDCLQVGPFTIRPCNGVVDGDPLTPAPSRPRFRAVELPGRGKAELEPPPVMGLATAPPAEVSRLDDARLLAVFDQFHLMQQEMFDQFHNTLVATVEALLRLHRDQMDQVRLELDQIHQLTHELKDLQAELARNASRLPPSPLAPEDGVVEHDDRNAREDVLPAPDIECEAPRPSEGSSPPPRAAVSPPMAGPAIHAWLSERIAALRSERQGRWQKIISFMTGR
jgi:pSer/pThr/pTyr-binding forkhead associated (FHA) protein